MTADLVGGQIPVFTTEERASLAVFAGVTLERDTGILIVLVADCDSQPIEGATIDALGGQLVYLGANSLPDASRTTTSTVGTGVIFNLSPREVIAAADVGVSALRDNDVQVVADSITATVILP